MNKLQRPSQVAPSSNGTAGRPKPVRTHKDSNGSQMLPQGYLDSTPRNAPCTQINSQCTQENHSEMDGQVPNGSRPQLTESPGQGDMWSSNQRAVSNLSKTNSHGRRGPQSAMLYQKYKMDGHHGGPLPFKRNQLSPAADPNNRQNRTYGPEAQELDNQLLYPEQYMHSKPDSQNPFYNQQQYMDEAAAGRAGWQPGSRRSKHGAPMQAAYFPHNMKRPLPAGYSFSQSSSNDDEDQSPLQLGQPGKSLAIHQSEEQPTELSNSLQMKNDNQQFISQKKIGINNSERSLRLKPNVQMNEQSSQAAEPAWYGPNGQPEDQNGDGMAQYQYRKPDEFHHRQFFTSAPKDLSGSKNNEPVEFTALPDYNRHSNNPPIDFDGYNDYGVTNYSRTEKKLTKDSMKKNGKNGSKTTGNRPEVHRYQNQQPWPTMVEPVSPTLAYNKVQKYHVNAADLDHQASPPMTQQPTLFDQTKKGLARHRLATKRNTMVIGNSKVELVKRMPVSSKSPTGLRHKPKQDMIGVDKPYTEMLNERKQAKTVMGRDGSEQRRTSAIMANDNSCISLTESNLKSVARTSNIKDDEEDIVAKLKSKCTTMSNTNNGTTMQPSPTPVIEPKKKGPPNKMKVMSNTQKQSRGSPMRANTKMDLSHGDSKHHYYQQAKTYYYTNNPGTLKGSPMAGRSPQSPSPSNYISHSRPSDLSKHKHDGVPQQRKLDEDKNKKKISPYKLIMFGEKDMYYKKENQQLKKYQSGARDANKKEEKDANLFIVKENDAHNGRLEQTSNRTSEPDYGQLDDFTSLEQPDFQVGDGLMSRQNGSRNAKKYANQQQSDEEIEEKKIECGQFTTQPKNLYDTESNARTESKDGSGLKNRQTNSEIPRLPTLDNAQNLKIEQDKDFKLANWDDSNERGHQFLKYRPKTQRYHQSMDSQFPIISEQDETFEGQLMKPTEETVSERNYLSKVQSKNSNLRLEGIQCTPESHPNEDPNMYPISSQNINHHRMEVKNYVDSFIENGEEKAAGNSSQHVNLLSSKMISNNNNSYHNDNMGESIHENFDDDSRTYEDRQKSTAAKTRNMNQSIAVKKAYNISRDHGGSTNEIITNGDNDQVLITLNNRHMFSGQTTMQCSVKYPSLPPSKTNSKPQSKAVSRKPSHGDVHMNQPDPVFPFESPKENHKIVFSNQINMGFLEPSCIEEQSERQEQTKLHSAEPELISEHPSPRIMSRQKQSDESFAGTGTVTGQRSQQTTSQKVVKDTDIRESLCSIPEEYPSQNEDGPNEESQDYGQKMVVTEEESSDRAERKLPTLDNGSVFITDKILKSYNENNFNKCQDDMHFNLKYPTPEDREPVLPTKCTTAQKSKSEVNNTGLDSMVTCSFKIDSDKQLVSSTDNKDFKQQKTSPQPRKLQKQTSLKTFHTFDPDGSKKRLQNVSKSADSNISNFNLNEIMHNDSKDEQQALNGSMDDVAAENSGTDIQAHDDIRVMTQEEYYQMKKEQLEDIYLGTEIIYEEDMENHEFSTLQTCQSAQRLILPNQFNNMNFEGNTTQSLSPKKRSSKGMMSPDSRKSWQITNSLEKQAIVTNTSQKIESQGLKDIAAGNQTAVNRINNLRKKYSIDGSYEQKGQTEASKVQQLPQFLKFQKPQIISNQPIVAFNETSKQFVIQNPVGPFVPSTNLKPRLSTQIQYVETQKSSKIKPVVLSNEVNNENEFQATQSGQMIQKSKQRSVSPLNLMMNPQLSQSYSNGSSQQNQPKSARNTSKTFQNQFKPKVRNASLSKQKATNKSPHQRPYTSNGVIKHGINACPNMMREKAPAQVISNHAINFTPNISRDKSPSNNTSPSASKKKITSKSNKQLKKSDNSGKKNETLVDQAYHQTSSQSQLQSEKAGTTKPGKKQSSQQNETYLATLEPRSSNQRPKGQMESHKLSWKKFLQHKKSQQHTQSHIVLNSSSSKIDNSHVSQNQNSLTLEKMNSQKVYNPNRGEIKTGQINLIDSDNGSVKSLDKVNENRRGRSEGKYSQNEQQLKSMYNNLESDIHHETLAAGSGLSLADNRLEDASNSKDGNLPRMASYTTHQASQKQAAQQPETKVIFNSPPKANLPLTQDQVPLTEPTSVTKKPLVPKLKLSKVQLHRGVPKPLLTPQGGPKSKMPQTLSLKTVIQKQTTARNNQTIAVNQIGIDTTDQQKKLMVKQQLSLPHVQANKKNMMKAAARERKWLQVNMQRKSDKKKRPQDAVVISGNQIMQNSSGLKTKQCTKRQVVIDLQPESPESALKFTKRLSIPIQQTQKIDLSADHGPHKLSSILPLSLSPVPQVPDDVDEFAMMHDPNVAMTDKPKQRRLEPLVVVEPATGENMDESIDQVQMQAPRHRKRRKHMDGEEKQGHDNIFEQTHENKSSQDRKISTADEFKKNHILKVNPQQMKLSAKNIADMGELHGANELIILSTNSEQRVHSRQSFKSPNKKNSLSDKSTPNDTARKQSYRQIYNYNNDSSRNHGEDDRGMMRSSRKPSGESGSCFNNGIISIHEQSKGTQRTHVSQVDFSGHNNSQQLPGGRSSPPIPHDVNQQPPRRLR